MRTEEIFALTRKISQIDEDSTKILQGVKASASVDDFYSVTPAHLTHAGDPGIEHFNFLLICIINDVNNAKIEG